MKIPRLVTIAVVSAGLAFGVAAQAGNKEKEETVDMSSLPTEVQKTIKDKAGDNSIIRVEKETRHGKEVYDAIINKDGKETGIRVDADGKYLGMHEEKEHKEKAEKE